MSETENTPQKTLPEFIASTPLQEMKSGYCVHPNAQMRQDALHELAKASDQPTLLIVPRTFRVDALKQEMIASGIPEAEIGVYTPQHGQAEKDSALEKKYLITIPSCVSLLSRQGKISPQKRPLVLAEAIHNLQGKSRAEVLKPYLERSKVIGFTAYDRNIDGTTVGERLFGSDTLLIGTNFIDAVEKDEAPPTKNVKVTGHFLPKEPEKTKEEDGKEGEPGIEKDKGGDYRADINEELMEKAKVNAAAVKMYDEFVDNETGTAFKGKRALVYCPGVKSAEDAAKQFSEKYGEGFAASITERTPQEQRKRLIEEFNEGKIKVLASPNLFLESPPKAEICFMNRLTCSPMVAAQAGASVMTGNRTDGWRYVVNFVDPALSDQKTFSMVSGAGVLQPKNHHMGSLSTHERSRGESPELPSLEGMQIHYKVEDIETIDGRLHVKQFVKDSAKQYPPERPYNKAQVEEMTNFILEQNLIRGLHVENERRMGEAEKELTAKLNETTVKANIASYKKANEPKATEFWNLNVLNKKLQSENIPNSDARLKQMVASIESYKNAGPELPFFMAAGQTIPASLLKFETVKTKNGEVYKLKNINSSAFERVKAAIQSEAEFRVASKRDCMDGRYHNSLLYDASLAIQACAEANPGIPFQSATVRTATPKNLASTILPYEIRHLAANFEETKYRREALVEHLNQQVEKVRYNPLFGTMKQALGNELPEVFNPPKPEHSPQQWFVVSDMDHMLKQVMPNGVNLLADKRPQAAAILGDITHEVKNTFDDRNNLTVAGLELPATSLDVIKTGKKNDILLVNRDIFPKLAELVRIRLAAAVISEVAVGTAAAAAVPSGKEPYRGK